MKNRNAFRSFCLVLLLPLTGAVAGEADWTAQEYTMAADEMIPSTKWGTNYVNGNPSVLVFFGNDIIGYGGFNRKLQEVKRAFGGEIEYVRMGKCNVAGTVCDEPRAIRLLDSRQWDLIVAWTSPESHTGGNFPTLGSADLNRRILARVADGAGLLFVMTGVPANLSSNQVVTPVPTALGGLGLTGRAARTGEAYRKSHLGGKALDEEAFRQAYLATYRYGKGRVAALSKLSVAPYEPWTDPDALPFAWDHRIDADYLNAEIVRAFWYAAGKTPQVEFVETPPSNWKLPWGASRGATNQWVFDVQGKKRTLTVAWRVRDLTGRVWADGKTAFKRAMGRIVCPVALPDLGAGRYYLDVFVDGPQGRETFGYSGIEVATPWKVTVTPAARAVEPPPRLPAVASARRRVAVAVLGDEVVPALRAGTSKPTENPPPPRVPAVASARRRVAVPGDEVVPALRAGTSQPTENPPPPRSGGDTADNPPPPRSGGGTAEVVPALRAGTSQPIGGTILIEPAGATNAPAPDTVVVQLLDNQDRVLDRFESAVSTNRPLPFTLRPGLTESLQLRVEAAVSSAGRVAGAAWAPVNVLAPRQDRFGVVVWGGSKGPYAFWARQRLRQTGVTADMFAASEDAGIARIPFVGGDNWRAEVNGRKLPRGLWGCGADPKAGDICVNDPAQFPMLLDFQDRHWKGGTETPVYVYNLYDEGISTTACQSPHCLAAYRAWLQEQYRNDLNALNTEWGSAYAAWDDVAPLDPKDNTEDEAKKQGNFARWSDRKRFGEVNFSRRMLGEQTRRALKFDPQARLGFEGSGEFGIEVEELLAHSGFWCPYDGLQTELVRSLKPAGYISGFWIGYDKEAEPLIAKAWRMAMKGSNSIWWWMLPGYGKYHGWLAPNDEPYPAGQQLLDECILPLRRGLGDLLMRLDRPGDGIALYYSEASAHAGSLGANDAFSAVTDAHASLARLIQDCGYAWSYTTKKRLLAGELEQQRIKLLVLPFTLALGQDEVDAMRKFAEAGGIVLADLRPGVYSGHCRPLEHSPAEALFGVERTGPGRAVRVDGTAPVTFRGRTLPLALTNSRADADLKPAGAAVGATFTNCPVFLVNTLGQGAAVLLNAHLNQDPGVDWWIPPDGERHLPRGKQRREFLRAFLAAAGIQPRVARTDGAGGELVGTETVTWQQGGVTLHGFYRDSAETTPAEIVLPRKAYAFHLRSGAKGLTDRVRIEALKPGYAEFVAVYPYDPGKPVVTPSARQAAGGQTVEFAIAMSGVPDGETGTFSFGTRLLNPKGEWVDVIPWSVQGRGGKAVVPVKFAYNDLPGTWTLEAREITTGRRASARVDVVAQSHLACPPQLLRRRVAVALPGQVPPGLRTGGPQGQDSRNAESHLVAVALPGQDSILPPLPAAEAVAVPAERVTSRATLVRETLGKDAKDYPPGSLKIRGDIGVSGAPSLVCESWQAPAAVADPKRGIALPSGDRLEGRGITVPDWGVWGMWNLMPWGCMGLNWVGADGKTKAQILSPSLCTSVASFQGDGWAASEMQLERTVGTKVVPKVAIRIKRVAGDPNLYVLVSADPAGGRCLSFELNVSPYGYHDPKYMTRTRRLWVAGQDLELQSKAQTVAIQPEALCGAIWHNRDCQEIGGLAAVFLPEEVASVAGAVNWPCTAAFELKGNSLRLALRPWRDVRGWPAAQPRLLAGLPDDMKRLRAMSFAWPSRDPRTE